MMFDEFWLRDRTEVLAATPGCPWYGWWRPVCCIGRGQAIPRFHDRGSRPVGDAFLIQAYGAHFDPIREALDVQRRVQRHLVDVANSTVPVAPVATSAKPRRC
jgi:hypothetical protein